MLLRCYKIQFPRWNLKSLKNSDMQSGIKASLRDLVELWVSPPTSPWTCYHYNALTSLSCSDAAEMELWKMLLHISASETASGGQNLRVFYCSELCQEWKVTSFYISTVDEYTDNRSFLHLSPLDPKLKKEQNQPLSESWTNNKDIFKV